MYNVRWSVVHRDRVTLAVLELIESGRLQKMRNEWWFDRGECSGKDGPPKKVRTSQQFTLSRIHLAAFYHT